MTSDNTVLMLPTVSRPRALMLSVDYLNGQTRWYNIPEEGWRVDAAKREIVVGRGVPRTMIPLDTVAAYHLDYR